MVALSLSKNNKNRCQLLACTCKNNRLPSNRPIIMATFFSPVLFCIEKNLSHLWKCKNILDVTLNHKLCLKVTIKKAVASSFDWLKQVLNKGLLFGCVTLQHGGQKAIVKSIFHLNCLLIIVWCEMTSPLSG